MDSKRIQRYMYCAVDFLFWLNPFSFVTILAPVVQTLDSVAHRIKIYPLDSAIGLPNTYPLDRDLSDGYRYPTFEQLGPVG